MLKVLRLFILFGCLACGLRLGALHAQEYKFEWGGALSTLYYQGDYASSPLKAQYSAGASLLFRHNLNFRMAYRVGISLDVLRGRQRGSGEVFPETTPERFSRKMISLDLRAEYNFYPYSDKFSYLDTQRFTPYLFLGAGVGLLPQGSLSWAPYLSVGVGMKYKLSSRLNLGLSYQRAVAFSDDIDHTVTPMGVRPGAMAGVDGFGKLSFDISWDIATRRSNGCD